MTNPKSERGAVLVLGARGAIGASICARFERDGYTVVGTSRQDFDLTSSAEIEAWAQRDRPRISTIVHSAGYNVPQAFDELSIDEIRKSFDANVTGFLQVLHHLRSDLAEGNGRIVVLSSIFGFLSRHGRLPYSMSKHALVGVTKTLAIEYGPLGILVNAVSPGYIETPLTSRNNDAATIARLTSQIPLGRLGQVDEIAEVVYFLGSDLNQYITGHDLVVDGGFSINGGPQ